MNANIFYSCFSPSGSSGSVESSNKKPKTDDDAVNADQGVVTSDVSADKVVVASDVSASPENLETSVSAKDDEPSEGGFSDLHA